MSLSIVGKNIELTDPIKEYISSKLESAYKLTDSIISIDVEVDKNKHHHTGDVFHVRINLQIASQPLVHAQAQASDLYAAIDLCRDDVLRQLRDQKDRQQSRQRAAYQSQREFKTASTDAFDTPIEE